MAAVFLLLIFLAVMLVVILNGGFSEPVCEYIYNENALLIYYCR